MTRQFAPALGFLALAACGMVNEVANVGRTPRFTRADSLPAPETRPSIAAVPVDSRFAEEPTEPASASLYRAGSADLFRDQRAHRRGDILTVRINVADKAAMDNATSRSQTGSEDASLTSLLGIDKLVEKLIPGVAKTAGLGSKSGNSGSGTIARSETISMTMSAVVTDVLPNGNLVIRGRQEMRVNFELRELTLTGIIRPQDVARDNSVRHTQIADARIAYGGRGTLSKVQQARYGQQIYDALFPF